MVHIPGSAAFAEGLEASSVSVGRGAGFPLLFKQNPLVEAKTRQRFLLKLEHIIGSEPEIVIRLKDIRCIAMIVRAGHYLSATAKAAVFPSLTGFLPNCTASSHFACSATSEGLAGQNSRTESQQGCRQGAFLT